MAKLRVRTRKVFHDLEPTLRKQLSERTRLAANLQYRGQTGEVKKYGFMTGRLLPATWAHIQSRLADLPDGRVLRVADFGPGKGKDLADLGKYPNVRIYTVGPNIPEHAPAGTHSITRRLEETIVPDLLDVAQSRLGGIRSSYNRAIALENALNSLSRKGTLVFHNRELSGTHWDKPKTRYASENDHFKHLVTTLLRYRKAPAAERRQMSHEQPIIAIFEIFEALKKQGFHVPNNLQLAYTYSRKPGTKEEHGQFVVVRGTRQADLSAFYEHPLLRGFLPVDSKRE